MRCSREMPGEAGLPFWFLTSALLILYNWLTLANAS